MELEIQCCHICQSENVRNILLRDERQKIYVQCADCGGLVGRYILSPDGYYHAGKGFESFLRAVKRSGDFPSGRDLQKIYEETESLTKEKFEKIKRLLAEAGPDVEKPDP